MRSPGGELHKGGGESGEEVTVNPTTQLGQARVPCLVAMTGDQVGQRLQIDKERARIGCAADAEMRVSDASIGQYHAEVYRDADGCWRLRDLGCANGTYVNGRRVDDVPLPEQAHIQVGDSTLIRFELVCVEGGRARTRLDLTGSHDVALGIYSRAHLDQHLASAYELALHHEEPLGLILVEVDGFAALEERLGEQPAVLLQRQLAGLITDRLRGEDMLARFGHGTLAIMVQSTPAAGALALAEALRKLATAARLEAEGEEISITVSIGVAVLSEDDLFVDHTAMRGAAESALARAQASGGDRVVFQHADQEAPASSA